jgi:tetratricopeptide (TPR) repeat protein
MIKNLIQSLIGRFGYCIVQTSKLDLQAATVVAYNMKLGEYELKLKQRLLELEVARRCHRDALAQLSQLHKNEIARATAPPVGPTTPPDLDADAHVASARKLLADGQEEAALAAYARGLDLIHLHPLARSDLKQLSVRHFEEATALQAADNLAGAIQKLVRTIEFDPANQEARDRLETLLREQNREDVTKRCYIYHNPDRGTQIYRETFQRALEYVAVAGIVGEVLEFGVLGGFTSRIICETMRDLFIHKQIHLFDSFEGLPEYTSPIDANSYDIAGRNLWSDRMRFPDSFIADLGEPIDVHIYSRLCEIIRPERLFIYRGFFEQTLKQPLPLKAALVHIDCDLYQSTKEVLTRLYEMDVLQDGCVLLFDDYNCFKASPNAGERRAFREFLEGQERFETTPFFTYGFNGAAFFLHEKEAVARAHARAA